MARARSLSEFQKAFSDEASCVAFLFKRRWPDGFICPGCSERRAAVLKSRPRLYECLDCGRQTLPIRLLPTPPTCRMLPGSGVKLCVGKVR